MTLEIIRGNISNQIAANALIDCLQKANVQGALFLGFPLLATAEAAHTVEGLLLTPAVGVIAFHFPASGASQEMINDEEDRIFYLLEGNLKKHEGLRSGRKLSFDPLVLSYYVPPSKGFVSTSLFHDPESFFLAIKDKPVPDERTFRLLCAAIQRVTTIKPRKRRDNVTKEASRGAVIKQIEAEIANLDGYQKRAAIEVPDSPQRIRGLAGSGKTVVLALKAAYLHTQYPDWVIWVTFHTRALRQQFEDLIERFTLAHWGDKPDWSKLRILHSWGSFNEPGVYSEICKYVGVSAHNFSSAKSKYGPWNFFGGICKEVLTLVGEAEKPPFVDAILIDEAQDLPKEFFKMVFQFTKEPKRIVWAYDELQNLSGQAMPSIIDMFGQNAENRPLVTLSAAEGERARDIVLPVCYRNTPWALTVAHALGLGIYRSEGLVQFFDDPTLLRDVGYEVTDGQLVLGEKVVVRRTETSYPQFFKTLLDPRDAVQYHRFNSQDEEFAWVAKEIKKNLAEDELDPDDILIIVPNAMRAKTDFSSLFNHLSRYSIISHLSGVTTGKDVFSVQDSVAVASIFRAKGNEAPMVYIVDSEFCLLGHEMASVRNVLFTAITRSRAWVRICGVGDLMGNLINEIQTVESKGYFLEFVVPTEPQLKKMRTLHRDRSPAEKHQISQAQKKLLEVKELIEAGIINPEALPELEELIKAKRAFLSDEDD